MAFPKTRSRYIFLLKMFKNFNKPQIKNGEIREELEDEKCRRTRCRNGFISRMSRRQSVPINGGKIMKRRKRAEKMLTIAVCGGVISAMLIGGVCILTMCGALRPSASMVLVSSVGMIGLSSACVIGSAIEAVIKDD